MKSQFGQGKLTSYVNLCAQLYQYARLVRPTCTARGGFSLIAHVFSCYMQIPHPCNLSTTTGVSIFASQFSNVLQQA